MNVMRFLGLAFVLSWASLLSAQQPIRFQHDSLPSATSAQVWHPAALQPYPVYSAGFPVRQRRASGLGPVTTVPGTFDYMAVDWVNDLDANLLRLVVGHELRNLLTTHNGALGQGGAFTQVGIRRGANGRWALDTDTAIAVNFSTVGWTANNCGGARLPNGNIISGEEIFDYFDSPRDVNPANAPARFTFNAPEAGYRDSFYTIPADLPQFGGRRIPLHHNFGWMVEFDPRNATAIRKHYAMGRFSHESAVALADKRTVILTDDFTPAVLFKFVADSVGDYRTGQLFAFQQDSASYAGRWVRLPRDLDSLIDARNVAIRQGATLFARLEWAAVNPRTGDVYLTETGCDSAALGKYFRFPFRAAPARHWVELGAWDASKNRCHHPYGSVLVLAGADTDAPTVRPLLHGGTVSDGSFNLASPDGMAFIRTGSAQLGYREWLVIQEDVIGASAGRQANPTTPDSLFRCEGFMLDLSIANPTLSDLHRLFVGAPGAELAGVVLEPTGRDVFLNHQHPARNASAPPYNNDAVWVLPGLGTELSSLPGTDSNNNGVLGYRPSPTLGGLFFTRPVDAIVTNETTGATVARVQGRDFVRLSYLPRGKYTLKVGNDTLKIIVE